MLIRRLPDGLLPPSGVSWTLGRLQVFGAGQGGSGSVEAPAVQENNTVSSSDGAGQLSSVGASTSASVSNMGTQGAGGSATGGDSELPEECVICLTEPKDTLLLPCRHLCVCSECFRHVDKCPVCRSAFDNYIVLRGAPAPAPQVAAAAAAAPVPSSNLSLVLPPTMSMSHPASTEAVVNAPRAARGIPGFVPGRGIGPGILEESEAPSHTSQAASRTEGGVLLPDRDSLRASVAQDGVYSVVL